MTTTGSSFLPLTESTFLILLSLVSGQKHGYAVLKDVETFSQGRVTLSTSTLYTALARLLEQALIERVENLPQADEGPGLPRKAYILSDLGRRVVQAETARLESLAATAQLRLREEGI
jgi:DNA-binding PadR family transcriptional regulator